jgi:hypothetical protein
MKEFINLFQMKILINKFIIFFFILFFITQCGLYKRSDVRDNPVNVEERVQRNIEQGRGIRFGVGKQDGGTFDFASSNELWRATVDTLDFVPLINASYSGGIIITDWFNGGVDGDKNNLRDLKITVKFLSNEIRSDAIDIIIHERVCDEIKANCTSSLIQNEISNDIKLAILKKAAFFEKNKINEIEKINKKRRPKKNY